ncbi:MAG: glycosyltransferase family 2 protein [Rhodobacteraceae bacterium]|nr:glycosyltransferase family 2 protein [Paracoccaceae bacterium]
MSDEIDWPCEVFTQYQDRNLGCRWGVIAAVDWFFGNEEAGVILEDDVIADPSFFQFSAELLERYRDEPRVMAITACNFQPPDRVYEHSYYFSCFNHVWGWASWRRAWALYDKSLGDLDAPATRAAIRTQSDVPGFEGYWVARFRSVMEGDIDTWDYGWTLACWLADGLTCTPRANLMKNIGFGDDATHTTNSSDSSASLVANALPFPLKHPPIIEQSRDNDDYVARKIFRIDRLSFFRRFRRQLKARLRRS